MKKTLVLTHEYYPFKGGVANYVYNLFRFYDSTKYYVASDYEKLENKDNMIKMKFKDSFIWPSWLLGLARTKGVIQKHKIEQIFTPNILPLGSIAMFSGVPYIISLHGLDINLAIKYKYPVAQKILKKAKYIVVNSEYTKSLLTTFNLPDEKIKLIYPSVEPLDDFYQGRLNFLIKKYNVRDNDKVLLTVGRLDKRKSQDMVVEAMSRLGGDLKYFIVGRGPFEREIRKTIKRFNLEGQVFIFNDVSDEDLVYYYKMADVFVLPQRKTEVDVEGFGMVFLEAMYYGLPIVAGKSGGVTEVLEDGKTAFLVGNRDLSELTIALAKILNDKEESKRLSDNARNAYKKFAGHKEQSDKLLKLLG